MELNKYDLDFSNPQEVFNATEKIIISIKSLEKELEVIQSACPHPDYTVKNFNIHGSSSFSVRRICDQCQSDIGYPTQEEVNAWIKS
jgi:hypothetical protein